jgi:hypothetical protein
MQQLRPEVRRALPGLLGWSKQHLGDREDASTPQRSRDAAKPTRESQLTSSAELALEQLAYRDRRADRSAWGDTAPALLPRPSTEHGLHGRAWCENRTMALA